MEKIKIGSTEFDLVPMGISEDTQRKTRSFKFTSLLSYFDVITVVSGNVTSVLHIGSDGQTVKTYSDIVAFKGLGFDKDVSIEDGVTEDVYTVTYSVDAVEKDLNSLKTQLATAQAQIALQNTQLDDLSNTIVIISMQNMLI
jgi:hypothetical protein